MSAKNRFSAFFSSPYHVAQQFVECWPTDFPLLAFSKFKMASKHEADRMIRCRDMARFIKWRSSWTTSWILKMPRGGHQSTRRILGLHDIDNRLLKNAEKRLFPDTATFGSSVTGLQQRLNQSCACSEWIHQWKIQPILFCHKGVTEYKIRRVSCLSSCLWPYSCLWLASSSALQIYLLTYLFI